jgi:hypothetical protein
MRTPIAFIFGALAATLVAAAAFRGAGQPLDSTFTYQGQLRNAGQLVNGNVDVRFTLWDSDVGGTQIGNANSFNNYPLADGRFALGLNFGTGAFNGDQRWVQVEFRNPAGTGQYLTLAPRDKILATPYALYALNSTASQWDYNPKTQALTSAQNVAKVGIGTNAPTAALEVVAAGGDDAVKLPAGSIGRLEVAPSLRTSGFLFVAGGDQPVSRTFDLGSPGYLLLCITGETPSTGVATFPRLFVNGTEVPLRRWYYAGNLARVDGAFAVPVSVGTNSISWTLPASDAPYWSLRVTGSIALDQVQLQ